MLSVYQHLWASVKHRALSRQRMCCSITAVYAARKIYVPALKIKPCFFSGRETCSSLANKQKYNNIQTGFLDFVTTGLLVSICQLNDHFMQFLCRLFKLAPVSVWNVVVKMWWAKTNCGVLSDLSTYLFIHKLHFLNLLFQQAVNVIHSIHWITSFTGQRLSTEVRPELSNPLPLN